MSCTAGRGGVDDAGRRLHDRAVHRVLRVAGVVERPRIAAVVADRAANVAEGADDVRGIGPREAPGSRVFQAARMVGLARRNRRAGGIQIVRRHVERPPRCAAVFAVVGEAIVGDHQPRRIERRHRKPERAFRRTTSRGRRRRPTSRFARWRCSPSAARSANCRRRWCCERRSGGHYRCRRRRRRYRCR